MERITDQKQVTFVKFDCYCLELHCHAMRGSRTEDAGHESKTRVVHGQAASVGMRDLQ